MVPKKGTGKPKLAIVSTVWRQNSHAEHMGDCFMHGLWTQSGHPTHHQANLPAPWHACLAHLWL